MFSEQLRYGQDPSVVRRTKTWGDPIKWNREAHALGGNFKVFTASWSDFFHEAADEWRDEAWRVIKMCPNLTFQILTKRADRIAGHLPFDWAEGYKNCWLGVSVSEVKGLWRTDVLRSIPSRVRFVSYEPALGPLNKLNLSGIHQVIYGAESGPNYRPDNDDWARDVLAKCRVQGVAFFFKQSGGLRSGTRPTLDGQTIQEFPLCQKIPA